MKLKAQNLSEFAICLAVVTSAILSMQIYTQRGLMAKYFGSTNYLLSQLSTAAKVDVSRMQYEPYYRESVITEARGTEDDPNIRDKAGDKTTLNSAVSRKGWEETASAKEAEAEILPGEGGGNSKKLLETLKNAGDSLSSFFAGFGR